MATTKTKLEAWKNATPGRVIVQKYASDGVTLRGEMVSSGKVIHLSPQERKYNQEIAASEDLDVFLNGRLQPVSLLTDDESSRKMAEHPNHITDEEGIALFSVSTEDFEGRLNLITNATAIQRLLELAENPNNESSFHQHKMLEKRLRELSDRVDSIRSAAPARDGRPEVELDKDQVPRPVTPW